MVLVPVPWVLLYLVPDIDVLHEAEGILVLELRLVA